MSRVRSTIETLVLLLATPASLVYAQPSPTAATSPTEISLTRAAVAPTIDGSLDDAAWAAGPLAVGDWVSYNPTPGDRIPQRTEVFATYDRDAIYFAFRCHDPEPDRIKSGVRRRDTLFSDDWVGLSLDSLGTRQTTFDMFVNPHGMQADILTNSASGESLAPDWVWESAGRFTSTGYEVELKVPLQSIRFTGGQNVRVGALFWRRVSRLGVSVSWPSIEPGKSIFERHATLLLADLEERRTREAVPSFTSSINQERETPSEFGDVDSTQDFGFSGKYGITSAVTVEASVNPDFSQVESDAFQVEVNQRYPLFFSEKRPFFMEGADLFALSGQGNDSALISAVHTRYIVDPIAGLKLTGSLGRVGFAVLSAADESPGREFDGDTPNPFEGKERFFHIGRAQYSLRPGSYVGAIATATRLAGRGNYVGGGDASLRINDRQRAGGMFLYSSTDAADPATLPDGAPPAAGGTGVAGHATYLYETRRLTLVGFGEHYDEAFAMEPAFLNQVGLTRGWGFTQYSFFPDQKSRYGWIRRVSPFVFVQGGKDRIQDGIDTLIVPGIRMNLTRQGFLRVDGFLGQEAWAGQTFDRGLVRVIAEGQVLRWLQIGGNMRQGKAVFYDPVAPYAGNALNLSMSADIEPTPRFSQGLSWTHVAFDRASTGERVYTVNVLNARSIYQFTKQFFVRGLVQYTSDDDRVLTDFLASYELRPGTVLFAGYGTLIEQRAFEEDEWVPGRGDYLTTRRGFFFKASYLFRF